MVEASRWPYLDAPSPIALAHRGGTLVGAENTMAAFSRAVELGFDYVETDVHATADGKLVAIHDPRLDRVSDASGEIARLPWSTVKRARIGGVHPVPLLQEVLSSFGDLRLNLDIKAAGALRPMIALLRSARLRQRVCIASFSDLRLAALRSAVGDSLCTSMGPAAVARLRLASLPRLLPGPLLSAVAMTGGAACVQVPEHSGRLPVVDAAFIRAAHRLGLPVHVWTVNDGARMQALLELGVDGIVSDDLVLTRRVFSSLGLWR